jgi:hypothetical protein
MRICQKCGEQVKDHFVLCRKCAVQPRQSVAPPRRLLWSILISSALMSVLAVVLADCIQFLLVTNRSHGIFQVFLWNALTPTDTNFVWFMAVRAIISFLVLWPLTRLGFRDRMVWSYLVGGWIIVDLLMV